MKINWRVRLRNKEFWLTIIPAVTLLVQQILALFGLDWQYTALNQQLLAIVTALFAVLAVLGVVADPTTPGISDSKRAMSYVAPGVAAEKKEGAAAEL